MRRPGVPPNCRCRVWAVSIASSHNLHLPSCGCNRDHGAGPEEEGLKRKVLSLGCRLPGQALLPVLLPVLLMKGFSNPCNVLSSVELCVEDLIVRKEVCCHDVKKQGEEFAMLAWTPT